jgi:HAE1 family hydrophobic/amphiphilic exporter-1
LQDADTAILYKWSPILLDKIRRLPGFLDVNSDLPGDEPAGSRGDRPGPRLRHGGDRFPDRERAQNAYGAPQVSTIYTPTNQYWVMMELLPQFKDDPDALGMLYIRSTSGKLVPLNAWPSSRAAWARSPSTILASSPR